MMDHVCVRVCVTLPTQGLETSFRIRFYFCDGACSVSTPFKIFPSIGIFWAVLLVGEMRRLDGLHALDVGACWILGEGLDETEGMSLFLFISSHLITSHLWICQPGPWMVFKKVKGLLYDSRPLWLLWDQGVRSY